MLELCSLIWGFGESCVMVYGVYGLFILKAVHSGNKESKLGLFVPGIVRSLCTVLCCRYFRLAVITKSQERNCRLYDLKVILHKRQDFLI